MTPNDRSERTWERASRILLHLFEICQWRLKMPNANHDFSHCSERFLCAKKKKKQEEDKKQTLRVTRSTEAWLSSIFRHFCVKIYNCLSVHLSLVRCRFFFFQEQPLLYPVHISKKDFIWTFSLFVIGLKTAISLRREYSKWNLFWSLGNVRMFGTVLASP